MNSSIIHDTICKLIHKKCHPKSYHSDIKYHMTLLLLFNLKVQTNSSINHLIKTMNLVLDGNKNSLLHSIYTLHICQQGGVEMLLIHMEC